jgi:hypothetical protein
LREPDNTLWCKEQIDRDPLKTRVEEWRNWISVNLRGRDLIFVGFWSDWAYLSQALVTCLTDLEPANIMIVDPADPLVLQNKAPALWAWASVKPNFKHIRQSGADFLDELRTVFSSSFMERLLNLSQNMFEAWTGKTSTPDRRFLTVTQTQDIYSIRRDSCGAGKGSPPREKKPHDQWALTGAVHLLLRDSGATLSGPFYDLSGRKIRVVNALGKVLSKAISVFADNLPPATSPDFIICVGAKDDGQAAMNVVRGVPSPGIVRPAPSGQWLNEDKARIELAI